MPSDDTTCTVYWTSVRRAPYDAGVGIGAYSAQWRALSMQESTAKALMRTSGSANLRMEQGTQRPT
ncbi:hypothetical protein K466DRAFT_75055 [Polyporus arcularius HHB13444]|uniref:Uncharacterized protein n=2 Tax=Polyporaceae TaxID=5317 RepID=A0A5C3NMR1_9APHY|nr:hypothetical protein OH76DRAFT_1411955 [Polyporus brumalis]TFK78515.1 hypothetical protein K466DRAFT_75055 [Polyporus arcularius HHB13444]